MESSMQSIFELCKELESEMTGKQVRLPIISYKHILHVREDVKFLLIYIVLGSGIFTI